MKKNYNESFEELGKQLKSIRKGKNITQTEVSKALLSQSQIARIENNISMPSTQNFINILDKLNITPNEFFYISNGIEKNPKVILLNLLQELSNTGKIEVAITAKELCTLYHNQLNDPVFAEFLTIIDCHLYVMKHHTFVVPKKLLNQLHKIWDNLFIMEEWHLYELNLICYVILFGQLDNSIEIGIDAIYHAKKYRFYKEANIIIQQLYFSLTTLLIQNQKYELALQYCTDYFESNLYGIALHLSIYTLYNKSIAYTKLNNFEQSNTTLATAHSLESLLGLPKDTYPNYMQLLID
ncbi:helix-turn-helix domain-containing protein [Culicoidibacter larvae]|uniref:Helix-turn-helix transcriptional regulator n=1 Tax=Culicoidibacter larvae TaxID=2579976 RepID=A0A5R8QFH9_9FIRM|nr:helix-turn-helix transcriptional regulator [Culicoidibacter larvae]TLG76748.1 helix-turn-helix transcriptional regulator [Culicoidibacter larvae]